jgi:magnesium chelatase subunit H
LEKQIRISSLPQSGPVAYVANHVLQIVAAVQPVRETLDACVVFPSMPAVMKLNKLGTFSMAQLGQSKSIIGDFIK